MLARTIFKAISTQQTKEAIAALLQATDINETNESGLTFLQIAAREGLVQVVLHLLNEQASVDKTTDLEHENPLVREQAAATPLYLAVENGHYLIADILLVAGANKENALEFAYKIRRSDIAKQLENFSIDYNVIRGLLYWGITQGEHLLKLALIQLNLNIQNIKFDKAFKRDIVGLIELACKLNHEKVVIELLKLKPICRNELHIRTAAYWAEINNNSNLHSLLCRHDMDRAVVLYQLFIHNQENKFFNYLKDSSKAARDQFTLFQTKNDYDTSVDMQRNALTHFWHTRNFAKWHEASNTDHETLLKSSLIDKNRDLLKFIMIASEIDIYEHVLKLSNEEQSENCTHLIELGWSRLGILSTLGSRGAPITRVLFSNEQHLLTKLSKEIKNDWFVTELLLQKVHEAYPDLTIAEFLTQRETPIYTRNITEESYHFFNSRLSRYLRSMPRLSNMTEMAEQKKSPNISTWKICEGEPAIIKKVASYLDENEQISYAYSSLRYYRVVSSLWKDNNSTTERLQRKLRLLDEFKNTLHTEIEQKSCLSHRLKNPRDKCSNLSIAGTLIFIPIFSGAIKTNQESNDNLSSFFAFLFAISSSVFLTLFLVIALRTNFDFNSNNSRFEKLSIRQFSTKLQKLFRQICSAFTWSNPTIFSDLDLSSPIQTIRNQFENQENLILDQLKKLLSQKNIIEESSVKKPDIDIVIDHVDELLTLDEEESRISEEKIPMLSMRQYSR